MKLKPIVICIDIDGTIIGDVSYHVIEWEILTSLSLCACLKMFRKHLVYYLKKGLLRPDFADFVMAIKSRYEHVEFFLYTASEEKWAQVLVPCIEEVINFKFQRPLFTRKHCIESGNVFQKSFKKIVPIIVRQLRGVYSSLKTEDVYENIILIDNNNNLLESPHRCILCPTYSWIMCYDILKFVDQETIDNRIYTISRLLLKYEIISTKSLDISTIQHQYYSHIASMMTRPSSRYMLDSFWADATSAFLRALKEGQNLVK
jgi:hypothetical protein